jgi:mono/diheme cytochrome c family protein
MTKRLLLIMGILLVPLLIGLLFTYDVIKIDWVSFMEIQPSYQPQEEPLPLPSGSIPIEGAAYIPGLGSPVNPVPADQVSLKRGEQFFGIACALCHGADGKGTGPFAAFLATSKPANLLDEDIISESDGAIFMTITSGVPGSMPSLRENLPDAHSRWDVVNYVRLLQGKITP